MVWRCSDCNLPVWFEVDATRHEGGWHIHADQPIRIHMRQHQEA